MKREILLERIDKLKQVMPWYVLEYYQSKLAVPYSFTTLYEYLKEYDRFFTWVLESGISDADTMAEIPLDVLEHMTKKDMESFILYLRERPLLNANTTKNGVSQTTINRTLSALSSLYKYLTESRFPPFRVTSMTIILRLRSRRSKLTASERRTPEARRSAIMAKSRSLFLLKEDKARFESV